MSNSPTKNLSKDMNAAVDKSAENDNASDKAETKENAKESENKSPKDFKTPKKQPSTTKSLSPKKSWSPFPSKSAKKEETAEEIETREKKDKRNNLNHYSSLKDFSSHPDNYGVQCQLEFQRFRFELDKAYVDPKGKRTEYKIKIQFGVKDTPDLTTEQIYSVRNILVNKKNGTVADTRDPNNEVPLDLDIYKHTVNGTWRGSPSKGASRSQRHINIYSYSAKIQFDIIMKFREILMTSTSIGSSTLDLTTKVGHHNKPQTIKLEINELTDVFKRIYKRHGYVYITLQLHHSEHLENIDNRILEMRRRREPELIKLMLPKSKLDKEKKGKTSFGKISTNVTKIIAELEPLADLGLYLSCLVQWKFDSLYGKFESGIFVVSYYLLTSNISYWPVLPPILLFVYNRWYWNKTNSDGKNALHWKDRIKNKTVTKELSVMETAANSTFEVARILSDVHLILGDADNHWRFALLIVGVLCLIQLDIADEVISIGGSIGIISQEPNIKTFTEFSKEWIQRQILSVRKGHGLHGTMAFWTLLIAFVVSIVGVVFFVIWIFGIGSLLELCVIPLFLFWEYGFLILTSIFSVGLGLWFAPVYLFQSQKNEEEEKGCESKTDAYEFAASTTGFLGEVVDEVERIGADEMTLEEQANFEQPDSRFKSHYARENAEESQSAWHARLKKEHSKLDKQLGALYKTLTHLERFVLLRTKYQKKTKEYLDIKPNDTVKEWIIRAVTKVINGIKRTIDGCLFREQQQKKNKEEKKEKEEKEENDGNGNKKEPVLRQPKWTYLLLIASIFGIFYSSLTLYRSFNASQQQLELLSRFDLLDTNHDGGLSSDELNNGGYDSIQMLLQFDTKNPTNGILSKDELVYTSSSAYKNSKENSNEDSNEDTNLYSGLYKNSNEKIKNQFLDIPGCCGQNSCLSEKAQSSKKNCIASELSKITNVTSCVWMLKTPGCCSGSNGRFNTGRTNIHSAVKSICAVDGGDAQTSESRCHSYEINQTSGKSNCIWVGRNEHFIFPSPSLIDIVSNYLIWLNKIWLQPIFLCISVFLSDKKRFGFTLLLVSVLFIIFSIVRIVNYKNRIKSKKIKEQKNIKKQKKVSFGKEFESENHTENEEVSEEEKTKEKKKKKCCECCRKGKKKCCYNCCLKMAKMIFFFVIFIVVWAGLYFLIHTATQKKWEYYYYTMHDWLNNTLNKYVGNNNNSKSTL